MAEQTPGFPWMKWFPRDFFASTRGWPLIARAVYRELLDAQWDMGGLLPADEEQLREIARATPAEWRTAWKHVVPKFPEVDGGRRNARLEQHREKSHAEYKARALGAEKTNQKRADRNAQRALSGRSASPERIASSTSTSTSSFKSSSRVGNVVGLINFKSLSSRLADAERLRMGFADVNAQAAQHNAGLVRQTIQQKADQVEQDPYASVASCGGSAPSYQPFTIGK
jgi:uncharacterized protein YdaU (DUF1376 family)